MQGTSRPARRSGLLLALALVCLFAVAAPAAALAGERVHPPRELVRQYPLDAGKTRLKSDEARAERQVADAGATRPVAARTATAGAADEDDDGAPLTGFILIGLGLSAIAAGAVWIVRAPSVEADPGSVAMHAPAATLRAAAPPATSPRRAKRRPRAGTSSGRPPTRGGGSVKDQPALQQRIAEMRKSGMTLQAIADTLNAEGVPTVRGGARWRPSSVQTASGYKRPGPGQKQPPSPARSASAR